MDDELKQLAALALRNAFWIDFSALVNKYLEAAKGLDTDTQEMQMSKLANVYGRDGKAKSDVFLDIWTQDGESKFTTTGHDTILKALEHAQATEVHLCGKKVFERRNGKWHFTGA